MKPLPCWPLWLLLAAPRPALGAAAVESCADRPAAQVYSFVAPPAVPEATRTALQAGRAHLRRVEKAASGCALPPGSLPSGYVVAALQGAEISFSAPEAIPQETLQCLRQAAQRQPVPAGTPRDLAVQAVWLLRPRAAPAPAPAPGPGGPASRRSFADIEAEVGRHLTALTTCLEELWQERPHAAGTLVLRLTIAESGQVDEAAILRREPSMRTAESCLLRIAERFRFPPRWGGGRTLMSYPLLLVSDPQAPAAAAPGG